ncbi:hypothetical protein [Schlesneria sp. DSM 10557]|uniref:hypothetical protein n=1 Tax=Schlesneria sp. DSM 10557 TaxID=3044399 RepID=UPI0035A17228
MSRRRAPKQESLELLLDTICNTFGGVLFIAILVVMLLQQTTDNPSQPASDSQPTSDIVPVPEEEVESLKTQLETAISSLSRLRENRDSQELVMQAFAPKEIQTLLEQRRKITSRQEAIQAEVDQLLADNTLLTARVETLQAENESVKDELEEAKKQLNEAEARLVEERNSRQVEARLPIVRSTLGKQEIGLVLRYHRLYVWHKYGPDFERLGLNDNDFVVIGEESDGLVTRPKPTSGVPLNEDAGSREAIRAVLRKFKPQSCYFAVIVRPDTYGDFRYLRDEIIALGFEYRLMPLNDDSPVTDRGGTGGKVQ